MSRWPGKYVIGLTGNIATGKSVIRKMLEHLGAYGIDADALSHRDADTPKADVARDRSDGPPPAAVQGRFQRDRNVPRHPRPAPPLPCPGAPSAC